MRLENVEEMPIHHSTWCTKDDEECILAYNKNDVYATYKFLLVVLGKTDIPFYKGDNRIELRQRLHRQFGIDVLNTSDIRMGERLMLRMYSKATGISEYELKKRGGSPRLTIALKDCIPHWANFITPEMQRVKDQFSKLIVSGDNLKGAINISNMYHGIQMDYGLGGCHSSCKPGIYEADDDHMILDQDIGSLYPSIAIQLGIYPEHLGIEFRDLYDKGIVSVRLTEKKKPKAERDNCIMTGYKKAANCVYGKSNEPNSPFYDPLYTLKTTIGGQMFISLWTEKLVLAIPEIQFLQHNTDGLTYILPKSKYHLAQQVSKEMTELTGLFIEDSEYSKVILRDVNNYIGVYTDNSKEKEHLKLKGCFEIDSELYKDPSMKIVPIALKNYFVYNIPIRETILNHTDIFDFCLRLKTNSKSIPYIVDIKDGKIVETQLNRTTRYYISKNGGELVKRFSEGKDVKVNVGYTVTVFNKYEKRDIKDYNLDYNFYIIEANKIKEVIDPKVKQLSLF